MEQKRIVSLEVIDAGSSPDVDSDFNSKTVDDVFAHLQELYGELNVCNITTFTALETKAAFKQVCSIYEVPFTEANKVSGTIPDSAKSLKTLMDPEHSDYALGEDFRKATIGDEWPALLKSAQALEGYYKNTGVHACGVLVSNKPLTDHIPCMVREDDGRLLSQWTYSDCESMGLIKCDMLGIKGVDHIQLTCEYIMKGGKECPNLVDIIHGEMDDEETYKLFQRGDTEGTFQFGTDLAIDYMSVMKPTCFDDLAVATALCRPGPMSANAHMKYAHRKHGEEEIDYIHPSFEGTVVQDLLEDTLGLLTYQETVMKISVQAAGMTPKESDYLRKAMGKKNMDVMRSLEEKFCSGAIANGYDEEAVKILWHTIESFGEYAFNKSHSVAYAAMGYQTGFLKAHYPVEFMSALIATHIEDRDKTLKYLQEASRMNISIGAVNINSSMMEIAPNFNKENSEDFDVIYGLSGVKGVSQTTAGLILDEREANGLFVSVEDFFARCGAMGITKTVFENLTLAGAFDIFGVTRKAIMENIPNLISDAKTKQSMGDSLFDAFGGSDVISVSFSDDEYDHVDRLRFEADVLGLYLTGHPLENAGTGFNQSNVKTVSQLLQSQKRCKAVLIGSIANIIDKKNKFTGRKSVKIFIDDGENDLKANLNRHLVGGIDKFTAREKIEKAFINGQGKQPLELIDLATNPSVSSQEALEKNNIYVFNVIFTPAFGDQPNPLVMVEGIEKITLGNNGALPLRLRLPAKVEDTEKKREVLLQVIKKASEKWPGKYPVHYSVYGPDDVKQLRDDNEYYEYLSRVMEKEGNLNEKTNDKEAKQDKHNKKKKVILKTRELPPAHSVSNNVERKNFSEIADTLHYENSGFFIDKNSEVEEFFAQKLGIERVDYGFYQDMSNNNEQ